MRVNQIRPGDSKRNGRDQVPPPLELHSDRPSAVPTILIKWLGGSMNYSYVLLSEQDGRFYISSTGDSRAR